MVSVERDWERRIGGRLKLRDLHILSKVVEWGSMVKAASHLGMSQVRMSAWTCRQLDGKAAH